MSDKTPRLLAARLALAEHRFTTHACTPEAGTDPDVLLRDAYWSHVAARLRPLDRIEAVPEDGAWYRELLVTFAGQNMAKVALLRHVDLETVDADALSTESHEVRWRGPALRFSVVRKADKAVVREGFASKTEAAAWLATNLGRAA